MTWSVSVRQLTAPSNARVRRVLRKIAPPWSRASTNVPPLPRAALSRRLAHSLNRGVRNHPPKDTNVRPRRPVKNRHPRDARNLPRNLDRNERSPPLRPAQSRVLSLAPNRALSVRHRHGPRNPLPDRNAGNSAGERPSVENVNGAYVLINRE